MLQECSIRSFVEIMAHENQRYAVTKCLGELLKFRFCVTRTYTTMDTYNNGRHHLIIVKTKQIVGIQARNDSRCFDKLSKEEFTRFLPKIQRRNNRTKDKGLRKRNTSLPHSLEYKAHKTTGNCASL